VWGEARVGGAEPYRNSPPEEELGGFELAARRDVTYNITLKSQSDIHNLFMMTPYYYKTGQRDQEKLEALLSLETELGFAVLIYRKRKKR